MCVHVLDILFLLHNTSVGGVLWAGERRAGCFAFVSILILVYTMAFEPSMILDSL